MSSAPSPLLAFDFLFYGEKAPNVYRVDELGKLIDRPHIEVKKSMSVVKSFKVKLMLPGVYKFSGFVVPKTHPQYLTFANRADGFFELSSSGVVAIKDAP